MHSLLLLMLIQSLFILDASLSTYSAKYSCANTNDGNKSLCESISELLKEEKISIIGAYYEVETGEVFFFE